MTTQVRPKLKCKVCWSGFERPYPHFLANTEPRDNLATRASLHLSVLRQPHLGWQTSSALCSIELKEPLQPIRVVAKVLLASHLLLQLQLHLQRLQWSHSLHSKANLSHSPSGHALPCPTQSIPTHCTGSVHVQIPRRSLAVSMGRHLLLSLCLQLRKALLLLQLLLQLESLLLALLLLLQQPQNVLLVIIQCLRRMHQVSLPLDLLDRPCCDGWLPVYRLLF